MQVTTHASTQELHRESPFARLRATRLDLTRRGRPSHWPPPSYRRAARCRRQLPAAPAGDLCRRPPRRRARPLAVLGAAGSRIGRGRAGARGDVALVVGLLAPCRSGLGRLLDDHGRPVRRRLHRPARALRPGSPWSASGPRRSGGRGGSTTAAGRYTRRALLASPRRLPCDRRVLARFQLHHHPRPAPGCRRPTSAPRTRTSASHQ